MCVGGSGEVKGGGSGELVSDIYILGGTKEFCERQSDLANGAGIQVKYYDCVAELVSNFSEVGPILVAERKFYCGLRALQDVLDENEIASPIVACADDASIEEIAEFIRDGGMNFVTPPNNKTDFGIMKSYIEIGFQKFYQNNVSRAGACRKILLLTNREREILLLLRLDSRSKIVGRKLGISHRTVEIHRKHIMSKLGVQCITSAVTVLWASQLLDRN